MSVTTESRNDPGPQHGWSEGELENPHGHPDKPTKVRSMFAAIAGAYDLNNRVHSLGMDVLWRRAAVRAADVKPGDAVLDVACGTGDLTHTFAVRSPASHVVGCDFTPRMLALARRKQRRLPQSASPRVRYDIADAQRLPYPDRSFDVVSMAFGIRNVADPASALRACARVLRPGGRLVILEFETPRNPLVRRFNDLYAGRVMPITATLLSGDRSGAYRYLRKSVSSFMDRDALCEAIADAGFSRPSTRELSGGICVCYRAVRGNGR